MKSNTGASAATHKLPANFVDGLLGLACGVLSLLPWITVCVLAERREAWDSGMYFAVALPLSCLVSAVAGWRRPRRAWRWPTAIVAGQALGLGITTHGSASLWPLGLIALAVLGAPGFIAANLAARRARLH